MGLTIQTSKIKINFVKVYMYIIILLFHPLLAMGPRAMHVVRQVTLLNAIMLFYTIFIKNNANENIEM